MNVKEELFSSDLSDSDCSFELPKRKRNIKSDPDWSDPDVKPKVQKKLKTESKTTNKVAAASKPTRTRKANVKPKVPRNVKSAKVDVKPKVPRKVKSKTEDIKPVLNEFDQMVDDKTGIIPVIDAKPKVPIGVKCEDDRKPLVHEFEELDDDKNGILPEVKAPQKRKGVDISKVPNKKLKPVASSSKVENEPVDMKNISNVATIVARNMDCSFSKANTLINMLNEGSTIPFLIRYRKNIVGDWTPTDMRMFKELVGNAKEVVTRAGFVKKKISAKGHLTDEMVAAIDSAYSMAELDDIYEPYKPAKVPSKLSIVRDLGLESVADKILNKQNVYLHDFVDVKNEHTSTLEQVKTLLGTAISEMILRKLKDVERLWRDDNWAIVCSKLTKGNADDKENFKKYYEFRRPVARIRADEVLAINRGVKKKILKMVLTPNPHLKDDIRRTIGERFRLHWLPQNDIGDTLNLGISMSQDKLMQQIMKKIRVDRTRSAEVKAIEVFNTNLKRLLLTPPFRCQYESFVLGIDPGKRNGCKIVIVNSKTLFVEENRILNLHSFKSSHTNFEWDLKSMIKKWGVEIIIIGNGVGCQEVETVVNNIIRSECPRARYTVIPEQGVSVYSCSQEAQEEYPNFTPEVVSSLSLVKRFFNPLHEYVKVDPKHLGVGMYQHDIDDKKLTEALQETVSEIVSVVGVDLNEASLPLLKSVAGLTESRAKAIIAHRNENGHFKNRKQLLEIKGIGQKTYQQCAGFVRIIPPTNVVEWSEYNILDQTIVHPEHYATTHKLLNMMHLSISNIGSPDFITTVNSYAAVQNANQISEKLKVDVDTTKLLLHALSMSLNQDIRTLANPPDFKAQMGNPNDLRPGMMVSGRVDNVTTFGAFVDIGVGVSGLLHFSHFSRPDVGLGDRIEAIIQNLDVARERIGLTFKRKISDLLPMNKLI